MAPEVKSRGSDLETFAAATHSLPAAELTAPLAELMRPKTIQEFVGQEGAIGKNSILRSVLESGQVPSLIFWGPPGCGKVRCVRKLLYYIDFPSNLLHAIQDIRSAQKVYIAAIPHALMCQ